MTYYYHANIPACVSYNQSDIRLKPFMHNTFPTLPIEHHSYRVTYPFHRTAAIGTTLASLISN